jgi:hypothetical protein
MLCGNRRFQLFYLSGKGKEILSSSISASVFLLIWFFMIVMLTLILPAMISIYLRALLTMCLREREIFENLITNDIYACRRNLAIHKQKGEKRVKIFKIFPSLLDANFCFRLPFKNIQKIH